MPIAVDCTFMYSSVVTVCTLLRTHTQKALESTQTNQKAHGRPLTLKRSAHTQKVFKRCAACAHHVRRSRARGARVSRASMRARRARLRDWRRQNAPRKLSHTRPSVWLQQRIEHVMLKLCLPRFHAWSRTARSPCACTHLAYGMASGFSPSTFAIACLHPEYLRHYCSLGDAPGMLRVCAAPQLEGAPPTHRRRINQRGGFSLCMKN